MAVKDKTKKELVELCKEKGIKGYGGKNKAELVKLIEGAGTVSSTCSTDQSSPVPATSRLFHADVLTVLPTLQADSAQIILADPPTI